MQEKQYTFGKKPPSASPAEDSQEFVLTEEEREDIVSHKTDILQEAMLEAVNGSRNRKMAEDIFRTLENNDGTIKMPAISQSERMEPPPKDEENEELEQPPRFETEEDDYADQDYHPYWLYAAIFVTVIGIAAALGYIVAQL